MFYVGNTAVENDEQLTVLERERRRIYWKCPSLSSSKSKDSLWCEGEGGIYGFRCR
jgi:hypothetical protein